MLLGMGPDKELLAIGAFARLCRLSVKQLRHYDELGLLPPAWVDPASGYRYYRPGQVRDATSIGLLRSLDVPLPVIGDVLAGAPVAAVLGDVRAQLEAELERRRRALASLEQILATGMPAVDVTIVTQPAIRAVTVRDAAPDEWQIDGATSAAIANLLGALAAAGEPVRPPLVGLFPLDFGEPVPIVVAAECGAPVPGTVAEVLPGGQFAQATHVGSYDRINLTAHGLLAWCAEHGHRPAGPIREVYLSDPRSTAPDQLVTQLMIELEDPR
ncbi:MerR family transcriptional regulator [Flindersiella endophytica]